MRIRLAMTVAAAVTIAMGTAVNAAAPLMALVPAGPQQSFFVTRGSTRAPEAEADRSQSVEVPAFLMDRTPVTRRQFAEFVRERPEWQRSQVTPVLTDSHYLEDWASDLDAGTRVPADAPVTRVSWFAASAYCQWKGKELPTVDQWERAAAGGGKDTAATREKILSWYSRPGSESLRPVGREAPNAYGLHDLHGLIWEWTLDFNSTLVSTENRDSGSKDDPLFCGAGSQGASDPGDYATFMRYALRNSLKASYTTGTLGFRCAKEMEQQ
jgi:formylglycine-generating enzyme required for sulfatase activity